MVFSTNQVRQLYVVTGDMTNENIQAHAAGTTLQDPGKTLLKEFDDWGQHEDPKTYEFFYVNALQELGHSDIIHRENIRKVTLTPAKNLRMYLPQYTITNNLTASTDYTTGDVFYVNFSFPGFLNATDEEIETKTVVMRYNYNNDGTVMSSTSTDPNYNAHINDWGYQMKDAIELAFNSKKNLDNDLLSVTRTSSSAIKITGKPGKPWYVGVADNKPTQIVIDNLTWENLHNTTLSSLPLENNSRVGVYGIVQNITGTGTTAGVDYIGNGKRTADLEYFCMGERGDQYRNVGWPNVIHTAYMIQDTSDTDEYDYLDIHYYFQGEGVRSDKSEKLLTLVAKSNGHDVNETLLNLYAKLCGSEANTIAETLSAKNVADTTADLVGMAVNVPSTGSVVFDYGTTSALGTTASSPTKNGNNYTKSLTSLSKSTKYYYAIKVLDSNSNVIATGDIETFTTAAS